MSLTPTTSIPCGYYSVVLRMARTCAVFEIHSKAKAHSRFLSGRGFVLRVCPYVLRSSVMHPAAFGQIV